MKRLADEIEQYIKELLAESPTGQVEIRRNALALRFGCVPAQISYVLSTRFTVWHGFYVESRRGGGGYIRIVRIRRNSPVDLLQFATRRVGLSLSEREADHLLQVLREEGVLSDREAALVQSALRRETAWVEPVLRDVVRASLLKGMLLLLAARRG